MVRMPSLAAWQWELYPQGHTTRRNLLLHILTVPIFGLGAAGAIVSAVERSAIGGAIAAACLLGPLVAQGRGHKSEPVRPVPFSSPWNFVSRFVVEQLFTFPRYVLSGGFARAWRAARA